MPNFRVLIEPLAPDKVNYYILADTPLTANATKAEGGWWIISHGQAFNNAMALGFAESELKIFKGE